MKKPNNIQPKYDNELALHFQNARRVRSPRTDDFPESSCGTGSRRNLVHLTATCPATRFGKVVSTICLFYILLFTSCEEQITPEEERARQEYSELMNKFRFPYILDKPTQVYKMPEVLREISGLGITKTGELGCIQDEQGVIFIYDTDQCEINRRIGYGKNADYEGVAFAGDDAFVLRTNGNIYRVLAFDGGQPVRQKHKSLLNRKNNTKGIAYEPNKNRILAICKDGYARGDGNFIEQLAIFPYDIDSNSVADSVAYSLNIDQVKRYAELANPETYREVFPMFYRSNLTTFPIYPSALAVHPKTGDIYITSGAGGLLFVLNNDGLLVHIERLREDAYLQIEGLTFRPDGTMLMASEGKDKPGELYEFESMIND